MTSGQRVGLGEVITKVLTDTVRKPSDPAAAEEGIFLCLYRAQSARGDEDHELNESLV